jgi:hypothetical protein
MSARNPVAKWSESDKEQFVRFLYQNCCFEIGDGGNWTKTTLKAAIAHLATLGTPAEGAPKTEGACRTQWNSLKKIQKGICGVLNGEIGSGLTYTDQDGFDIGAHNDHVWRAFVRSYPYLKPFRNAGWPLFDMMNLRGLLGRMCSMQLLNHLSIQAKMSHSLLTLREA